MSKVVLIAGGSRGIGAACVEEFTRCGWTVASVSRKRSKELPASVHQIEADLTIEKESSRVVTEMLARCPTIDAVVHSVGDIYDQFPIHDLPWSRWMSTLEVCLGTAVNLTRASCDHIAESHGSYVFLSSVARIKPYPGIADYCAAKAALNSFVRSLALELAPMGRANAISPAVVDTGLFRKGPYSEEQAA